jgi:hypothetical protein
MTTPTAKVRCSALARELPEHLYGTAPAAPAWILLEQPGPWGADALTESSLDPEVAAELNRRAKEYGFRILLVRRSAAKAVTGGRSCFLARAAQSETWMERLEVGDPGDLLEIDPTVLSRPTAPGLGQTADAMWAVCTHGRRDPCCAEYGRRLVRSFETVDPYREGLWESSHQGGHRFAANLALFPHGLFYGQVEPEGAARILDSYRDRRLVLDGYRGRSAFDPATQAADYMVRREVGLTGIDDLVAVSKEDLGGGLHRITFDGVVGGLTVTLEESDGPMRRESCNKPKLTPVKLYRWVDGAPNLDPVGYPTI